jgi:hypothetical protein
VKGVAAREAGSRNLEFGILYLKIVLFVPKECLSDWVENLFGFVGITQTHP